ncbi:MAG: FAD-dependent thymidylate synthase [Proteobacteria bacterium]|nr:FAD-dependent thymidylate synthase [Pseudomonadota bacterium]NIS69076.1 FAD-dependent thymidylate synthase [Pseudomonadota bacterium]
MRIIDPSFEILDPIDGDAILAKLERAGRTCYKSEDRITAASAPDFVRRIMRSGHDSVIEHISISVKFVCDRGVTHELVRHRLASYSQESTRYANYSRDRFGREITVIKPLFWSEDSTPYREWKQAMKAAEIHYMQLTDLGATPQEARSVLPNSLKTEVVMTCNLREWRHILELRCSSRAHPQIRELMLPLLKEFHKRIPVLFDDLYERFVGSEAC